MPCIYNIHIWKIYTFSPYTRRQSTGVRNYLYKHEQNFNAIC